MLLRFLEHCFKNRGSSRSQLVHGRVFQAITSVHLYPDMNLMLLRESGHGSQRSPNSWLGQKVQCLERERSGLLLGPQGSEGPKLLNLQQRSTQSMFWYPEIPKNGLLSTEFCEQGAVSTLYPLIGLDRGKMRSELLPGERN